MSDPVILVGRRSDGGRRDLLWNFCKRWWVERLGWPISVGYHDEGPFSLAAASNDAAASASRNYDWDVALYVGADVLLGDPKQAMRATELALARKQLIFAHDHYYSLSEEGTTLLLGGEQLHGRLAEWPPWPNTFSSCLAVPRSLWEDIGGFDERFQGWGFEDLAFWSACCALAGGFERVTGPVFHLWHERKREEREENPHHSANQVLGQSYLAAKGSRPRMLAILRERDAA